MKIIYLNKFPTDASLDLYVETKEGYMIAGVRLQFNTEDKLTSKIPAYNAFFGNIRLGDDREIILGAVKLFNMINKS